MDGPARDSICVYPTRPPSPPADFIRVDLRLSLSSASRYPLLSSPPFFLSLRSRTYDEKLDDERRHLNWFRSTVRWSLVLLDVSRKKKREIQNFFLPSSSFEFVPEISESWKNFLDVQAFRWSLFKEISFNRGISSHFNMKF